MSTLFFTHKDCLLHDFPGHPECAARLANLIDYFSSNGLIEEATLNSAPSATLDHIQLIHPKQLITNIESQIPVSGHERIDADTYLNQHSLNAALRASGALIDAINSIANKKATNAFCATRPPGHHAEENLSMGFCLFNHIAIAAAYALTLPDFNRVAILDFDVHHCNGTVQIFQDREEVLVCSTFQKNFYPHRFLDLRNDHIIPSGLEAGASGKVFRQTIESTWLHALEQHKPDLILISAGFDAHKKDPLAELNLDVEDYRWVTQFILAAANSLCEGRVISTLEGGYHIDALARSAGAHFEELLQAS